MASTAGPSSRLAREQAGPLPSKVGELHYAAPSTPPAGTDVPEAEGDITEAAAATSSAAASPTATTPHTGTPAPSSTTASAASQSTSSLPQKHVPWYKRVFSANSAPLVLGFRGPTLLRFIILLLLIGGLSATWALSSSRVAAITRAAQDKPNKNTADQMAEYMGVFLHVAFAVVILVLLIFIERCVFILRAERWRYNHPGETLPIHRGGERVTRQAAGGLSAAPWNRPPLPTYAAALGYSGTGDVEDDTIAAPPPPAYGNTRGSVLLLTSALRRISGSSLGNRLSQLRSPMSPRTPRTPREFQQIPESRPVSYISTEGFEDVQRAHQLEMSLARLEAGTAPSSQALAPSSPLSRR